MLSDTFGAASEELEAYHYAKLGETGLLPEEAQEAGMHSTDRESLHQRKQVLESCLAQLELKRAARVGRDWRRTVGERIDGRTVAEFMSKDVRSVHKGALIKEAGRLLQKWRIGSLLVDDGSRYIGIITDTDLSRKAVAKGLDPNSTTVLACMSKSIVTIEDSEPIKEALRLMKKEGIRHLPVTEDGTIIGVLSVGDLLRAYQRILEL
ncbi:MAG: signal-transduction protein with CBS domain protein [Nitrospira sp. OLB3]|nr:MAG: signal-transduction protein with CBS domain protein [Nitrospira sp. OLB3]